MAARVTAGGTEGAKVLRFDPSKRHARRAPGRRVVAVVLDDGTVRQVDAEGRERAEPFQSGQLSGDGWILWWERRSFQ